MVVSLVKNRHPTTAAPLAPQYSPSPYPYCQLPLIRARCREMDSKMDISMKRNMIVLKRDFSNICFLLSISFFSLSPPPPIFYGSLSPLSHDLLPRISNSVRMTPESSIRLIIWSTQWNLNLLLMTINISIGSISALVKIYSWYWT